MHQGQRAFEALIVQVREKDLDLGSSEHPLVDHRPRREGGEVDVGQLVFNPLAQDEGPPLEVQAAVAGRAGHEDLVEARHGASGDAADG